MAQLPEARRYNQSSYEFVHNEIFSLLESGYSVQKIVDYLNENHPEKNFKLQGIYAYIRRKKKNGNAKVIPPTSTEKKSVPVNLQQQEQRIDSTPKIKVITEMGSNKIVTDEATAALYAAGLVGNPTKKDDDF